MNKSKNKHEMRKDRDLVKKSIKLHQEKEQISMEMIHCHVYGWAEKFENCLVIWSVNYNFIWKLTLFSEELIRHNN